MDYKTLYIIMEYNVLIAGSALVGWTELPQYYAPNCLGRRAINPTGFIPWDESEPT